MQLVPVDCWPGCSILLKLNCRLCRQLKRSSLILQVQPGARSWVNFVYQERPHLLRTMRRFTTFSTVDGCGCCVLETASRAPASPLRTQRRPNLDCRVTRKRCGK